jgi:hypothetical protein
LEAYIEVGSKSFSAFDGKFVIDLSVLLSVTPKNMGICFANGVSIFGWKEFNLDGRN